MLFPKAEEVTQTWRSVVEAVITDRLGQSAKVAPEDGKDERLSTPNLSFSCTATTANDRQSASIRRTSGTKKTCSAYSRSSSK